MMSKVIEVSSENFKEEVLNSEIPVLVDFWAPWCQPCLMMSPILDELAEDLTGKLKIVKVNTETGENQNLAMEYQIQSIPNMKLFKNGTVVKDYIGLRQKEVFKQELETEL
ncbi:MAG: thioredoxin [Candidatus Pacebacteria bacterium]|nr:thioredoxin [Candidatus Paceibacterota bacterium]